MDKVDSEDVYQGCKHGASSNIQNHTNMLTPSKFAAWDLQAAHTTWDIALHQPWATKPTECSELLRGHLA